MGILKEEIKEKDKEIKQLLEEQKLNDKSEDLIEKNLISKLTDLLKITRFLLKIENVYLTIANTLNFRGSSGQIPISQIK